MKSKYIGRIIYLKINNFYRDNPGKSPYILVLSLEQDEDIVILTGIDDSRNDVKYTLKKKLMYHQMHLYKLNEYVYKSFVKSIFRKLK